MSKSANSTKQAYSLSGLGLTFLGTASAQPSSTRNHSALALRLSGDIWLFDCGEATQHQLQRSTLKLGKVKKIFITHTHGDHIFGLLALMASRLNGSGGTASGVEDPRTQVNIENTDAEEVFEIYGPSGSRGYVRAGLTYTHTLLGSPYVVHELRLPSDPAPSEDGCPLPLHASELSSGQNLIQDTDGTWQNIMSHAPHPNISISAAPIHHSCPCVGYVLQESPRPGKITNPKVYMDRIKSAKGHPSLMRDLQLGQSVILPDGTTLDGPPRRPGRKIAILGDTFDPSPIAELACGADLLVHEATNAHLPGVDPATKVEDTFKAVEERTKSRGHSTPQMAGAFAKRINAKALVLNHFSARYKGDKDYSPGTELSETDQQATKVMNGIRALAVDAFGSERVTCARDFMDVDVNLPDE